MGLIEPKVPFFFCGIVWSLLTNLIPGNSVFFFVAKTRKKKQLFFVFWGKVYKVQHGTFK